MEFVKEGYVYSDSMENGSLQGVGYSSSKKQFQRH
jgi:hypothetical protein